MNEPFWLKDAVTQPEEARPGFQSLEDSANLPDPHTIAADIMEDLQAAACSRTLSESPNLPP